LLVRRAERWDRCDVLLVAALEASETKQA
jgi:hypothetical protein